MNEMLNGSILQDKNGKRLQIMDQAAREQAAQNAERIGELSEEITELKGGSTSTTTEYSGIFVEVDCDENAEITVTGVTAETSKLFHCGKNLMPAYDGATSKNGVDIIKHDDGLLTLSGTTAGVSYLDIPRFCLPAGEYTMIPVGFPKDNSPQVGMYAMVVNSTDGTISKTVSIDGHSNHFALDKTYEFGGYYHIRTTFTGEYTVGIMLVRGNVEPACDYEAPTIEMFNGGAWENIKAYEGVNTLYTDDGQSINVSATGAVIDEDKAQSDFEPRAYGLPMLYLTGDVGAMTKDNAVDLTYKYGDLAGIASVKWQGSSSLSYPKKNYTIKFDNAFEVKEGWGTQKKYCFKANYIDHSHARNVVSCKLWGEIVKSRANVPTELSSLVNGGAIDGFPCIIMLNNEFHGLYTWNIPKDGWMFGSPKAIVCADTHCDATKFRALATLNGDFELEYVEDEDNAEWVLPSLNAAIQAVMSSDGSDLDTTVGQYIDIPSAIDYFIHTVDESADDCTDKNYILVTYDGVKWYFSAYDRDTVYGLQWHGKGFLSPIGATTFAKFAEIHRMMNLIYTYKKTELKARAVQLRNNIKSEANVGVVFTNFISDIPSQVLDEDARKWPTIPSTSASNLAQILNWYRLRRAYLDPLIDAMT